MSKTVTSDGQSYRLDDLRLFSVVAQAGSFTAAAEQLGLPKQTVSRRIRLLEESLGVRLLHRTTRTSRLTTEGAAFAEHCHELARLAEEATRSVQSRAATPQGTLRVTTTQALAEPLLAPLLADYLGAWPEVSVDLLLTNRRVDLVEEGFDLALRVGPLRDSGLVTRRLGPARVRFCASPSLLARLGAPAEPAALADYPCVMQPVDSGPSAWPVGGPEGLRMVPVCARLRANSAALVRQAALDGLGLAMLPEAACAGDLGAGRLVTVLDDHVPDLGVVQLVYPGRRLLAARVRAFIDLAVARLGPSS
ncbi:MAG: LysR family transcriptional regulator [Alphaproteobacteria bacterium]|nr:LysR family transcriptional regulator [Alphaproteobacteria bacterium]